MSNGRFDEIKQASREFFLDVHAVADNFLGEHDWQWIHNKNSKWNAFKDEMMEGARFYSNDSELVDRVWLGIVASAYSIPYFVARLPYDGILNTVEYASWRTTGEAKTSLYPQGRKPNAYVIGAPVSAPFIGTMAVAEAAVRAAGVTEYGKDIVKAADLRAGNMLGRYLNSTSTPEAIAAQEAKLTATPVSKWNYIDRVGYVTAPGAIAAVEVTGAAALSGILMTGEATGRVLGLTPYSAEIVKAASMRSGNMLGRYLDSTSTPEAIAAQEAKLTASAETSWNVLDRAGFVTLPGVVAAGTVVGGATLAAGLMTGEATGRVLGFTPYGADIIKAAGMRTGNMLDRYLPTASSPAAMEDQEAKLTATPETRWNYLDRAGFVTLPGIVAAGTVVGGATLTAGLMTGEATGRVLGLTPYGADIIKAAGMRSGNMLDRYFHSASSPAAMEDQEAKLTASPETRWNYLDRAGFVTLPGVVAAGTVVGGATLATGIMTGEATGRVLGLTQYGADIIKAAGMRSGNMLGRYLDSTSTPEAIAAQEAKLTASAETSWNVLDRAGFVTLPGVVAAGTVVGGATLAAGLMTGEATGRVLGLTQYGADIIKAAGMRSGNMLDRYFHSASSPAAMEDQEAKLTATPETRWNYLDRAGFVTLPGIVAAGTVVGGATLATGIMTGEATGRVLGLTPYGAEIIKAAAMRSGNMLDRYFHTASSPAAIEDQEAKLTASPETRWNYLDRAGFVTLPGIVAAGTVVGGATLTAGLMTGEATGRVLGLTPYGAEIIKAAAMRSGNMLDRYFHSASSPAAIEDQEAKLTATSETSWNYLDRLGYVTLPGAIAAATVTGGAALTAGLMTGEATGRALGISNYGKAIINASHMQSTNLLTRYIKKSFTQEEIAAERATLKAAPETAWNAIDRLGYITFPGLIAGAEIAGAGLLASGLVGGEAGVRALGITEYGGDIIKAAGMRSGNMMSRYFDTACTPEAIAAQEAKLKAPAETSWDKIDRAAFVTLPGLTAAATVSGAGMLTAGLMTGEAIGRGLGFSPYGRDIIKAADIRAANMLDRYFHSPYTPDDIKNQEAKLTVATTSAWDIIDRAGYITLPGVTALAETTGAAILTAGLMTGEATGRVLGLTPYGADIIKAAAMRSGNMLSRYFDSTSTPEAIAAQEAKLTASAETSWNYLDRAGFVTLPGVVAAGTVVGGAALTAGLMTGEVAARTLGFTEYGLDIVKAAGMRSGNMLDRYFHTASKPEDMKAQQDKLTAPAATPWNNIDRVGFVTLPGIVAAAEVTGAGTLAGTLMAGEATGRALGFTEYGLDIIKAAGMRSGNMLDRYFHTASKPEDMKAQQDKLTAPAATRWNKIDRLGFVTLPGVAAATAVTGAALVGGGLMAGEGTGRLLGFSQYGADVIKTAGMYSGNVLDRYFHSASTSEKMQQQIDKLKVQPVTPWDYMDRVGACNLPAAIGFASILGAHALHSGLVLGEATGRALGFTQYGADVIKAGGMQAGNILDRYFHSASTAEDIQKQKLKLEAKATNSWDVADRVSLVTLPGTIASAEILGAHALNAGLVTCEATARGLGVSNRSLNLHKIIFSHLVDAYGSPSSVNREPCKEAVFAPVKNGWDAADSVGSVVSGAVTGTVAAAASLPAFIGLSKSNWHRFSHFIHQLHNDLNERRAGTVVDRAEEMRQKAKMEECASTPMGEVTSNVNLLYGLQKITEGIARYIIAPIAYGSMRVAKEHLFGVIPIINCMSKKTFDIADPFDRIKKRFDDLLKALDVHGHLPVADDDKNLRIQSVIDATETAKKRPWYQKLKYSALSEGRTIFSLGHTAEEKVIKEFKTKFNEFTAGCKRNNILSPNSFFTKEVRLPNGEKFSYEAMVAHIEGTYASQEEKRRIRRVAELVRTDIEKEMQESLVRLPDVQENKPEELKRHIK